MAYEPQDAGIAAEELTQFIERVERLEEEKKALADDIKDVFAELKGRGFDVKAVREILRIRKLDASERQEAAAILELITALELIVQSARPVPEWILEIAADALAELRDPATGKAWEDV